MRPIALVIVTSLCVIWVIHSVNKLTRWANLGSPRNFPFRMINRIYLILWEKVERPHSRGKIHSSERASLQTRRGRGVLFLPHWSGSNRTTLAGGEESKRATGVDGKEAFVSRLETSSSEGAEKHVRPQGFHRCQILSLIFYQPIPKYNRRFTI